MCHCVLEVEKRKALSLCCRRGDAIKSAQNANLPPTAALPDQRESCENLEKGQESNRVGESSESTDQEFSASNVEFYGIFIIRIRGVHAVPWLAPRPLVVSRPLRV